MCNWLPTLEARYPSVRHYNANNINLHKHRNDFKVNGKLSDKIPVTKGLHTGIRRLKCPLPQKKLLPTYHCT